MTMSRKNKTFELFDDYVSPSVHAILAHAEEEEFKTTQARLTYIEELLCPTKEMLSCANENRQRHGIADIIIFRKILAQMICETENLRHLIRNQRTEYIQTSRIFWAHTKIF